MPDDPICIIYDVWRRWIVLDFTVPVRRLKLTAGDTEDLIRHLIGLLEELRRRQAGEGRRSLGDAVADSPWDAEERAMQAAFARE